MLPPVPPDARQGLAEKRFREEMMPWESPPSVPPNKGRPKSRRHCPIEQYGAPLESEEVGQGNGAYRYEARGRKQVMMWEYTPSLPSDAEWSN